VGFWPIAGYLPPPPASGTADQIAAFYRDNAASIRLGVVLTFAGCAAWGHWSP
jgi:predicted negative regulator of RcsB-dependent stress response